MKKLMKAAQHMRGWWLLYYSDAVKAQRRVVEEDARRLGGRVLWEDMQ